MKVICKHIAGPPADQTSISGPYLFAPRISSGGLQQLYRCSLLVHDCIPKDITVYNLQPTFPDAVTCMRSACTQMANDMLCNTHRYHSVMTRQVSLPP